MSGPQVPCPGQRHDCRFDASTVRQVERRSNKGTDARGSDPRVLALSCLNPPPDAETAGTILVRIPERLVDMFTGGSKGMRRFFLLLALAAAIAGFPFLSSQRSFARKKASYCDAIVYADLPEWLVVGGAVLVCVAILWRYLQRYPRRAAPGRR